MAATIPPGVDIYADIRGTIIGPVITLMCLCTASVILRVIAKRAAHANLELDDYLIFAALAVALSLDALSIYGCSIGVGLHVWNPKIQVRPVFHLLWAFEFLYSTVIPLTKLSILAFYYRLFPVVAFHRAIYVVVFLVVGWLIASFFVIIFQCRPYSYLWEQHLDPTAKGQCIDMGLFFVAIGASSVATDFLVLLMPIPMVWSLQMRLMKRLSVLGVFALGGFVCVAGVVRVFALKKMFASPDFTWSFSQGMTWSAVEPNIGIVCACLPITYSLLRRFLPSVFGGSSYDASAGPSYATGNSRMRSQNGEFYALHDRKKGIDSSKSEDEMGLTNEIHTNNITERRQPQDGGEDGSSLDHHMNIMVKRDVRLTETSL